MQVNFKFTIFTTLKISDQVWNPIICYQNSCKFFPIKLFTWKEISLKEFEDKLQSIW